MFNEGFGLMAETFLLKTTVTQAALIAVAYVDI
jgi:hypothetical protein